MTDNAKERCAEELANKHGRQVAHRFSIMISNREDAFGQKFNDAEIQDMKVRFETEIYRELLMKDGK